MVLFLSLHTIGLLQIKTNLNHFLALLTFFYFYKLKPFSIKVIHMKQGLNHNHKALNLINLPNVTKDILQKMTEKVELGVVIGNGFGFFFSFPLHFRKKVS